MDCLVSLGMTLSYQITDENGKDIDKKETVFSVDYVTVKNLSSYLDIKDAKQGNRVLYMTPDEYAILVDDIVKRGFDYDKGRKSIDEFTENGGNKILSIDLQVILPA